MNVVALCSEVMLGGRQLASTLASGEEAGEVERDDAECGEEGESGGK